jgi:cell division protein FtsB
MDIGRSLRRQLQSIVAPTVGLALSAYFAYHLVEGERGLYAWVHVTQEIRAASATQAAVSAERAAEERRVALLRPDHIDPDLLDEQARAALNLGQSGDVVILDGNGGGGK